MSIDIIKFIQSNRDVLDLIIDMVPIPLFVKDREGRYIDCNIAFKNFLSISREQIIGKTVYDLWSKKEADVFFAQDNELFNQGGLQIYETQITSSEGVPHEVQFHKQVFTNSSGVVLGFLGAIFDITELKKAEERLKTSERKFKVTFVTGPDAFFLSTLKEGRIIEVNDRYESIFGFTREETIGRTALELNLYENPDDRKKFISEVKARGQIRDFEARGRKKNGNTIEASLSATLLQIDNEPHVLAVIRDITERKEKEAERERLIVQLREALSQVKTLSGLIPICASCKKIRDDKGYWEQLERYIMDHSDANFSHGICPDCMKELYPDFYEEISKDKML